MPAEQVKPTIKTWPTPIGFYRVCRKPSNSDFRREIPITRIGSGAKGCYQQESPQGQQWRFFSDASRYSAVACKSDWVDHLLV
jgi:hypothetical protein